MKNLMNKNLIIFGLLFTLVFSLATFLPAKASAHVFGQDGENVWNDDSTDGYQQDYSDDEEEADNPTPVIYSIKPSTAYQCSGSKNVDIYGKNFISSSVAKWNGSSRVTNYVNSSHLVVKLTSNDICGSGNYLITVYNNHPGGGLSNGIYFTIVKTTVTYTPATTTTTTATVTPKPTTTPKVTTSKPKTVKATTKKAEPITCQSAETTKEDSDSQLSANALFGSNGFMPKNIFQWLLLFLIILLIVLLARSMSRKNNHEKPLKHA